MSETSIAIPLHTLKALLDEVSEHYADGIPKGFLQIDATPQPPGTPTPRRRRPPQPRRTRARSSQTTTYQAKRAAMEDLPLKRLRRHGFTPYFGDEKRFLMTPPEFDLVLACEARQVSQVIHEVLRQSVGYPGDGADGRREWVALSFRHFERRGLLSHQDAKI